MPYWLVNVPREQWTSECPDFLKNECEKNRKILATPEVDFRAMGWDEVKQLIGEWTFFKSAVSSCHCTIGSM